MKTSKGSVLVIVLIAVLVLALSILVLLRNQIPLDVSRKSNSSDTPSSVVFNPFPYQKPVVPKKRSYITFLVGDSMVKALGKNANQLRMELIKHYPDNEFVNYNYGFGATNILTLPDRFNQESTDSGETFPPILKEEFDLIIIESFAYNPLSANSIEESLDKHTRALDEIVKETIRTHPNSIVAIMVTIAPSKTHFAKGVYDLSSEERQRWAEERIRYIDNAIKFAEERNLPLINVYEKSLLENGDVDLKYVNPSDFIHPSDEGIKLISKTIADFIFEKKIFPE